MCDITEPKFFDTQACYEYVINGAVFGSKSLLKDISTLPANSILEIEDQKTQTLQLKSPVLDNDDCAVHMTLDQVASYHCKQLDSVFEPLANAYGDNIKLSFSGGFDSRLSLAMLMQHGVKPKLFVYGNDNDEDVVIAQTVAKAESLELECINKSTAPIIEPDSYKEITQANFYAFDVWKVESGIFDFGTDRNDRLRRHVNEQIPLNGSLGEIYRNFFYIPNKKMRAQDVVSTFYSQYNKNAFSSKFKESEYRQEMAGCMKSAINSSNEHLERYQIEQLYPHFRGRFWTGRDAQLNQRFGKMLFPFLEPAAISNTSKIPLNYKDLGYLQGRMISQVNSRLANYPSDYGFSLNGVRPLKYRLKTFLSTQRPPFTRKLSFRLKNRHKELLDTPLSQPYLSRVIDEDFPIMRNLFNIDLINSAKQYGLIATLEYLGERYNLEVE
jgi:asparagine synthase (glutamine-hydrolysing)